MKILKLSLLLLSQISFSQITTLIADGPGNTYELINSVLAPGYNVIEVPDCVHTNFGRHIEEIFDAQLNKYVFKFHIHATQDNDRCINFDRQRNEIKTYNQSPAHLIGTYGEKFVFKWKFKLDANFQGSNRFTHIHQIKAYGGPHEDIPVVSIIARGGSTPRLEIMHSDSLVSIQKATANLSLFKGIWVEATETITYEENGKYQITLKNVATNATLLTYTNNNIRMWRDNADGIRPKWGIYRSILSPEQIRDEQVLFADFYIEQVNNLSTEKFSENKSLFYPNPVIDNLNFQRKDIVEQLKITDIQGKTIFQKNNIEPKNINLSSLPEGIYTLKFNYKGEEEITEKVIKTK